MFVWLLFYKRITVPWHIIPIYFYHIFFLEYFDCHDLSTDKVHRDKCFKDICHSRAWMFSTKQCIWCVCNITLDILFKIMLDIIGENNYYVAHFLVLFKRRFYLLIYTRMYTNPIMFISIDYLCHFMQKKIDD